VTNEREAADRAVDDVVDEIARRLAAHGWRRRQLDLPWMDTLSLDLAGGIIATVDLSRAALQGGDQWPREIRVHLGVGWEPALGLRPLVTLPVWAELISQSGNRDAFSVELPDSRGVEAAADEITTYVDEHALAFAATYPSIEAIDVALRRGASAGTEDDRRHHAERRLVVLAAMGRVEDAAVLLGAYREAYATGYLSERVRRFARQLDRRLANMPSPIPPAEDTLAQLPPGSRLAGRRQSRAESRTESRSERASSDAARDAIRAQEGGKSAAELRALIVEEYDRRDIAVTPLNVAAIADVIVASRRPFGNLKWTLRVLRMAGSVFSGIARAFGGKPPYEDPEWMSRPDRAAYPVPTSSDDAIGVDVAPAARAYLDRAWADGHRIGPFTALPLWLSSSVTMVEVHLGTDVVGTIGLVVAAPFGPYFRAAAHLFDEDLAVSGQLFRTSDGVDILQVEAPKPRRSGIVCG
jgi:hypothetical protein